MAAGSSLPRGMSGIPRCAHPVGTEPGADRITVPDNAVKLRSTSSGAGRHPGRAGSSSAYHAELVDTSQAWRITCHLGTWKADGDARMMPNPSNLVAITVRVWSGGMYTWRRMMTYKLGEVAVFLAAAMVTGCSSAPYGPQATSFGTATLDMTEAHAAMLRGERLDQQRLDRARVLTGGYAFVVSTGCTSVPALEKSGCRYETRRTTPEPNQRSGQARQLQRRIDTAQADPADAAIKAAEVLPDPPAACLKAPNAELLRTVSPVQAVRAAIQADGGHKLTEADIIELLSAYAEGLKAITDTSERAAFDAASSKLATSAGALATTLGTLAGGAGAAIGPIVVAAVKLGTFATAQAYENARYEALRGALLEACLPLRTLAFAEGAIIEGHRTVRMGINVQTLGLTLPQNAGRGVDRAALFTLGTEATDSTQMLDKSPIAAMRAMVDAHDKLAVAVIEGQGQTAVVEGAITNFVHRAQDFRSAVSASTMAK